MTEAKKLSPEARQALMERPIPPVVMAVEAGHVRRFAEAVGDLNQRWTAPGGEAPPTFLRAMLSVLPPAPELSAFPQMLDGGSDWEYGAPVLVGDTVTAVTRFAGVNQRGIAAGPAVFLQIETTYTNQRGEFVATQKNTLIRY